MDPKATRVRMTRSMFEAFNGPAWYVAIQAALFVRVGTDSNIALSGGVTVFTGVGERMRKELRSLAPSTVKMKVGAPRPSERLQ